MRHTGIIQAAVIAIGLAALGLAVKSGMDNFTNKDRKVTVKGLSEMEVAANKVTWPIVSKEIGNDLPALYDKVNATNAAIRRFLIAGGLDKSEISVNAPVVIDLNADRYSQNQQPYRYNVTSVITVTSAKVELVRKILARQGGLLKDGIAIVSGDYDKQIRSAQRDKGEDGRRGNKERKSDSRAVRTRERQPPRAHRERIARTIHHRGPRRELALYKEGKSCLYHNILYRGLTALPYGSRTRKAPPHAELPLRPILAP